MSLFGSSPIFTFEVFPVDFKKKETVFVSGREFHSLTFRKSGEIIIEKDGKALKSPALSVTYVPKGCSYHTEVTTSGDMIALHFNMVDELNTPEEIKVFTPKNPSVIGNLFSALLSNYTPVKTSGYSSFALLYEILSILEREENAFSSVPEKVRKAKEFMDNNLSDPSLSVSSISEHLNISEVYLRREFKAYFGVTPLSYINSLRFEYAKSMLKTGYYTVSEVSEKCGFSSLSYFSASFRKEIGLTPSEFILK